MIAVYYDLKMAMRSRTVSRIADGSDILSLEHLIAYRNIELDSMAVQRTYAAAVIYYDGKAVAVIPAGSNYSSSV